MINLAYKVGDMFTTNAEAIVNTVNCVGVMGKGVALEFKRRWPENYKFYKRACDKRELRPGKILTFDRGGFFAEESPRYLINFPTKDHWRAKSKLEYIESGLDALVAEIERLSIKSIALPPLGCGNGGLDWNIVKPLIAKKLSALKDVQVEIYGPFGKEFEPEYVDISSRMTRSRALYIKSIASLEPRFGGTLDRLSLQKVAYFLQQLGVPFNLEFKNSLYGPYSATLKKALVRLVKWRYLEGYINGDRSARVSSAGYAAADEYLRLHSIDETAIDKLSHLIQGYDSPYGLELLSTTHFNVSRGLAFDGVESASDTLHYRKNNFPPNEVSAAKLRLVEDGLIDAEDF